MNYPTRITGPTLAILLLAMATGARAALPLMKDGADVPTLAPLLEKVTPAVVNIAVTARVQAAANPLLRDPFFRRFFNVPDKLPPQTRQAAGSGVIIDAKKGYVVTNNHVVDKADEITVRLKDQRAFKAKLIGTDPATDVALLKIDPKRLTAVKIGDSDRLRVGDFVIAIGNPFGLGQTVTSGIVSALGRSGLNIEGYEDFIQTDASINPGNSGGALVDLHGHMVGMNTAIIGPSGGNVGIGFAVPGHMIKAVIDQLIEHGEVRRGQLGVTIQNVTPDVAKALGLESARGAVVSQVLKDSGADNAGIKPGDVITAVDGRPIRSSSDLRNHIGLVPVGTEVKLDLLRDGKPMSVTATIGKARRKEIAAAGTEHPALAGATFGNLTRDLPQYGHVEGVVITRLQTGSPAQRTGLRVGDIVVAVNRKPVRNVDEFSQALKSHPDVVALNIVRGETQLFLVIR